HFTWARAAEGTVARYREAVGPDRATPRPAPATPTTTSDTGVYPESRATC
ncbi:glycosyltransferase family 1 protein, partial [Streptomyces sp. SID5789]|nr:glycosyltransferase family 1 protein [Streptomyces sp. SID5789]